MELSSGAPLFATRSPARRYDSRTPNRPLVDFADVHEDANEPEKPLAFTDRVASHEHRCAGSFS
jgi:hypothetical protein